MGESMKKNLGNKSKELNEEDIKKIIHIPTIFYTSKFENFEVDELYNE